MNQEYEQIFKEPEPTKRVGDFGEYIVKKYLEMEGYEVKKSDIKTVDLVCYEDDKPKFAVEVKTHKGTEDFIAPSPEKFHCLHIKNSTLDNLKSYQKKYNLPVYIFWVRSTTGKIFVKDLRNLMEEQTFNSVTFPRRSQYKDAPKTAFAEQQFIFYTSLPPIDLGRTYATLTFLSEQINAN